ncbi:MAG: DUF6364 family protein [Syntrophomonadaceae bacterium]|jgi:hypothetical protein|nr:DUF6364 family protein [Syntrophomonadaceae bacterium]
MGRQNVTLSLSEDVIKKAKHLAVDRDMSLSALLSTYILDMVAKEEQYAEAKEDSIRLMEEGFDMGSAGENTWKREELHERS